MLSVDDGEQPRTVSDEGERSADPAPTGALPRPSGHPGRLSGRPSAPGAPAGVIALRLAFAAAWIGLQIALILTAGRRADGAFGFRMFGESSTIRLSLYREVGGVGVGQAGDARGRLHVDGGAWTARDAGGMPRRFSWYDRVKRPEMGVFEREISASYGAAAQLARLQLALDDVAAHIPDDAETTRLLLDVTVRRNGGEPYVVHLASAPRGGTGS